MKINRYKKVNKILKFYSNNFGFRKPYQVLIDGTICVAALQSKVNIQEQFSKYLDGEIKLLTTQCIINEMEKLGSPTFGALIIIKQYGIHRCGHEKSPVTATNCILDMIGNKNSSRYIVATQDKEIQLQCRKMKGVPLLYLHSKTPTLEAPSSFTQDLIANESKKLSQVSEFVKKNLSKLKENESEPVLRKRKKKGGPNPLSCKKKKTSNTVEETSKHINHNKKKRKRNRSRLVKKIKNEMFFSENS